jgi:hypothetical protein
MDSKFVAIGIGLLLQAGTGIWYIASVDSRVSHNNYQIQMMTRTVDHNADFVSKWPSGKWGSGSLPDDVKQNLKITYLEKQMDKIMSKLYNGGGD